MPVLCRFDGIIIKMYFQQEEHNPPHIHAKHGDHSAAIDIRTGKILDGYLPARQLSVINAWIKKHKKELLHIWTYQDFHPVDPSID